MQCRAHPYRKLNEDGCCCIARDEVLDVPYLTGTVLVAVRCRVN